VLAQRDRILAQAQEEAERTRNIAREKSDQLLDREAVVQSAQARANEIVAQAQAEREAARREADEYAVETLRRLEMELERFLNQARNGIRVLSGQGEKDSGS
jgi:hypothetical protein